MQTQKHTLIIRYSVPLFLVAIALLAAGCATTKPSDLQRPVSENNNTTTNTTDNGEVAGAETITLPTKNIKVGGANVEVEIADTDDNRAQGLSDRKKLDEGKGMLFDFTNTDYKEPGFWMKDMFISIDMIWINDGKIIGITPNVPLPEKNKELEIYYPPSEVTHVLEVPAGWSVKNNLNIGDAVNF